MDDDFGDFTGFSQAPSNSAASTGGNPSKASFPNNGSMMNSFLEASNDKKSDGSFAQFDANFTIPPPMSPPSTDVHMAGGVPFDIPPLPDFDDLSPSIEMENPFQSVTTSTQNTVKDTSVGGGVSHDSIVQPVAGFASSAHKSEWAADFSNFDIPPPIDKLESLGESFEVNSPSTDKVNLNTNSLQSVVPVEFSQFESVNKESENETKANTEAFGDFSVFNVSDTATTTNSSLNFASSELSTTIDTTASMANFGSFESTSSTTIPTSTVPTLVDNKANVATLSDLSAAQTSHENLNFSSTDSKDSVAPSQPLANVFEAFSGTQVPSAPDITSFPAFVNDAIAGISKDGVPKDDGNSINNSFGNFLGADSLVDESIKANGSTKNDLIPAFSGEQSAKDVSFGDFTNSQLTNDTITPISSSIGQSVLREVNLSSDNDFGSFSTVEPASTFATFKNQPATPSIAAASDDFGAFSSEKKDEDFTNSSTSDRFGDFKTSSTSDGFGDFKTSSTGDRFGDFKTSSIGDEFGDFKTSSTSDGFGGFNTSSTGDGLGDFKTSSISDEFGDFKTSSTSDGFGDFKTSSTSDKFGDFKTSSTSDGFGDFKTSSVGDDLGSFSGSNTEFEAFSSPKTQQKISQPMKQGVELVLVSCFTLTDILSEKLNYKLLTQLLEDKSGETSMWGALQQCVDLTIPLYKWDKSSLKDKFYTSLKVDPMLISRPSTLSILTGITKFSDPLGGATAAEDLMESFGFEAELEDTRHSASPPPLMGYPQRTSGERATPTLLDLSLPETPGSPTGYNSFTLNEDLTGLDLNPQPQTQQLTSIEELLRNERLVVNKSTWVDSQLKEFGEEEPGKISSPPATPGLAKRQSTVEFQLKQLGLDAKKVSSFTGEKRELSLRARTVLGRLPDLSFMLTTDKVIQTHQYSI